MKNKSAFILIGIGFPIFVHLYLLDRFAINLPFKDDYRVLVNYLYLYFNTSDKLKILLLPDNESYPVLMRIITIVQTLLDGQLNFRHILLLCNLFLLLLSGTLAAHFYRRKEYWNIAFMCLLVFNTMHHEMYFRTDVGTYQLLSFSFSIFLFYGASYYNTLSRFTRVLFYIALIITPLGSINGMLAIAMVVVYFMINQENKRAMLATTSIFLIQVMVLIILKDQGKSVSVWENLSKYNFELLYAYFVAMGGVFIFTLRPIVIIVVAVVTLGIFGFTFYRLFFPFKLKLNFEKLVFLFCAGSLALIVILRYNYWIEGISGMLESRYKLYGSLIILLFFSILGREKVRLRPLILVFLLGLFCVGIFKGTAMLNLQQLEQLTEAYNVSNGVYKEDYAEIYYLSSQRKKFLEDHNVFSFKEEAKVLESVLVDKNQISAPKAFEINAFNDNPLDKSDASLLRLQMKTFKLRSDFPHKKYYFVKFENNDGSFTVLFLNKPPRSIIKNIFSIPMLHKLSVNFYPDAFKNRDFSKFNLYGIDDLGL